MIWTTLKQTGSDIWDELLNLIAFNLITLIGTLLIIPWPFVTFGLFEMAYDISQGKGIKFSAFFTRAAQVWKQAYLWGLINLSAILVVWVNLNFYKNFGASWAGFVQVIIVGFAIFWFGLQLIVLPIYPRLEEPGFKIALRNAAVLMGRYPLPALLMLLIVAVITALPFFIPQSSFLIVLGYFSFTAVLCNRMVSAMVRKELGEASEVVEEDPGFNIDVDEE